MTKFAVIVLGMFFLTPCVLAQEVYQIGEWEIRLYNNKESLIRDAPLPQRKILKMFKAIEGICLREKKVIYSLMDLKRFLSELKECLEPGWSHPALGCTAQNNFCLERKE